MPSLKPTRAWLLPALLVASSIFACSDDEATDDPQENPDGGQPATDAGPAADAAPNNKPDAGLDANVTAPDGATNDAAQPSSLKACVERPNELARPPTGELPCELLPPGFTR